MKKTENFIALERDDKNVEVQNFETLGHNRYLSGQTMLVYSNVDDADETQKTISGLQKTCSVKASESTCEVKQVDSTKQTQESCNAAIMDQKRHSCSFQPPGSPISADVELNETVGDMNKENQQHTVDQQVYRTQTKDATNNPMFSPEVSPINFKQGKESKVDQSWFINQSNAFADTGEKQNMSQTRILS